VDDTTIQLFGFSQNTGGIRSLCDSTDTIDFVISFITQDVSKSLMVDVKTRTVVHDPLSVDGLAALATHTPAFLFPKIYRGPARCSMQALSEWQLSIDSRHSDSAALAWSMPTVDGPEASCELESWYACSFVEHVRLEGGASTAAMMC